MSWLASLGLGALIMALLWGGLIAGLTGYYTLQEPRPNRPKAYRLIGLGVLCELGFLSLWLALR